MPADLDFNGYFMLTGGSGYTIPDSVFIREVKVADPKEVSMNEHFQQARAKKASFENLAGEQADGAHDLLHEGSDFGGRPKSTELVKLIPKQEAQFRITAAEVQRALEQGWSSFSQMLSQQPNKHMFDEMEVFNIKLADQLDELEVTLQKDIDELETRSADLKRQGK